jgi:hypothetical protein
MEPNLSASWICKSDLPAAGHGSEVKITRLRPMIAKHSFTLIWRWDCWSHALQLIITCQTAVTANEWSPAIREVAESGNQVPIVVGENGQESRDLPPCRTDRIGDDRLAQLPGLGINRNVAVAAWLH